MTRNHNKHGITLQEYRNTAHLYLRRGEEHPCAKLTAEKVRLIRKNPHGLSDPQMAAQLGVSRESVRDARTYTTWRNVK